MNYTLSVSCRWLRWQISGVWFNRSSLWKLVKFKLQMGKKYVSEFKVAILKFREVCKIQMLHCTPTWAELKLPTPSAYNTHRFCSIVAKGVWNFCDFLETQWFPTNHIDLYLIWMPNKWGTLKILSLIIFLLILILIQIMNIVFTQCQKVSSLQSQCHGFRDNFRLKNQDYECNHYLVFFISTIITIIINIIIIIFTFSDFQVVGKLPDQVDVTGCQRDWAPKRLTSWSWIDIMMIMMIIHLRDQHDFHDFDDSHSFTIIVFSNTIKSFSPR